MRVHVAFTPDEAAEAPTGVVIDVIRATSTICQALASGYERAYCAAEVEEARALAERIEDAVLGGERKAVKIPGFDLGNSPSEYVAPQGRAVVMSTTKGTHAIVTAAGRCERVLVASLLNLAAVVAAAHEAGIHQIPAFESAENVPGFGTTGIVNQRQLSAGNLDLLRREGVAVTQLEPEAARMDTAGRSVVAVSIDGREAGLLAIADVVRPSAIATVAGLKRLGIEVALLTGDNEGTARAVAAQVGIDRVFANVKPGDKADYVRQLQREGHDTMYDASSRCSICLFIT